MDQRSDDLDMLRSALEQMQAGIVLLDERLNAQFINRAARELWKVSDELAGRRPSYVELINRARTCTVYGVPLGALDKYIKGRVAVVRAGDPTPIEIPHADGRTVLSQCAVLPNGGRMITYTDVTGLVRRANEFRRLASHDGMTGVCNRRQFDLMAQAEWARFQRYHRPLSLMLMDIDRFKQINDRLGHDVGDKAIKQMAEVCTAGTRTTDVVARFGGDEFVALLPETDLAQARVVAERLRKSIRERSETGEVPISVSIGIAAATASMHDFAALMRLADKALYQAKDGGRDRVVCLEEPQWFEGHAAE